MYWNRRYEPHGIASNKALKTALLDQGIAAKSFNAGLLFEPWDVANKQGGYFKVFTPFWRHCQTRDIADALLAPSLQAATGHYPTDRLEDWRLLPTQPDWAIGIKEHWCPGEEGALERLYAFLDQRLSDYAHMRDVPAAQITSGLSPHLHFGEIGPRQLWHAARHCQMLGNGGISVDKFLSELGWREFSYYLLYHVPTLASQPFNPKFSAFDWVEDNRALHAWQSGKTGYPIVDAGMRELWCTGTMHNRVRMIVASFLTKDLLIDWRKGAAWFWDTLVDADLASNSASWQWVAGSGADASPYYRIFNPVLQGEKFDPKGEYVRRWVPELGMMPDRTIHSPWKADKEALAAAGVTLGTHYPFPIVDHTKAREEAMRRYKAL